MEGIDSPPIDEAMARGGRSCAMQSSFFLPGIVPDVARIVHSFAARFLEPFVQFILVLIESVATKDIPPRKRGWVVFLRCWRTTASARLTMVSPYQGVA